jgi:hypothetical protein
MPHDWSHLVFSTLLANEQYRERERLAAAQRTRRSLTLPVLLGTQ